jgi:hypothetical protein
MTTIHTYSATAKPCGARFRLTILADGRIIDKYYTSWPVVYVLICGRTQAEGIAQLRGWVKTLRRAAAKFERAQTSDPDKLFKFWRDYSPFAAGLVTDGWYEAAARGLRERLRRDRATLARLRSGREEYYEPYARSYHRRRDLAVRACPRGERVLDIIEVVVRPSATILPPN